MDIKHYINLAKIGATDEEAESFSKEIAGVLDFVKQLDEVDVSGVKVFDVVVMGDFLREDEIIPAEKEIVELIVEAVPSKEEKYFKAPSIFN